MKRKRNVAIIFISISRLASKTQLLPKIQTWSSNLGLYKVGPTLFLIHDAGLTAVECKNDQSLSLKCHQNSLKKKKKMNDNTTKNSGELLILMKTCKILHPYIYGCHCVQCQRTLGQSCSLSVCLCLQMTQLLCSQQVMFYFVKATELYGLELWPEENIFTLSIFLSIICLESSTKP